MVSGKSVSLKIEYHRTWYNVEEKDSKIRFEHMKDGRVVSEIIHIPHGYYTNIEELTDRINTSLIVFGVKNGITQMPQLRADKLTRKINIRISNGMRIIFSPGIGNILGYNEKEVFGHTESVVTLTQNVQHGGELSVTLCVLRHSRTRHRWRYESAVTSLNFRFG